MARPSSLLDRRSAPRGLLAWLAPLGGVFRADASAPPTREARATAAAKAAEAELYQLFCVSLGVQRDLGANFQDLGETRLVAARGLRAWLASGDARPDAVRVAASRALRLVQDYPFSFTSTVSEPQAPFPELAPRPAASADKTLAWARHYTLAYPDAPAALARLADLADEALGGPDAPRRPLRAPLLAMAAHLASAQRAAWDVRRALEGADR